MGIKGETLAESQLRKMKNSEMMLGGPLDCTPQT